MTDLISRSAAIAALQAASARPSSISEIHDLPAIVPQIIVDVTGGVLNTVCGTHDVGVNTLDYEVTEDEQDDYVVNAEGEQAWLYGDTCLADPARFKQIMDWPTVEDLCLECRADSRGGEGYDGYCGDCADRRYGGDE